MEHRWGQRVAVDVPIRLTVRPFSVKAARLMNLSLSGAFIKGSLELRVLSRIQVVIDLPSRFKHATPVISAYVTRKFRDGIGVEWCEFAPQAVSELIRSVSHRRFPPLRIAELTASPSPGPATLSTQGTLKHGT
jgi:PilZ domain